jgi:hypothetical protein
MDGERARTADLRKAAPPPPRNDRRFGITIFLGCGFGLLGVNHLSVVLGQGLHPEAMVGGALALILGLIWVVFPNGLDAIDRWTRASGLRLAALLLAVMAASVGSAEGLARWWYGESLFS